MTTAPTRPAAPRRVLVIGSRGFIGAAVTELLGSEGWDVLTLDRPSSRTDTATPNALVGPVTIDAPVLREAVAWVGDGPTILTAGSGSVPRSLDDPHGDLIDNGALPLAVFDAVRAADGGSHVVLVSSAAVYGEAVTLPVREDHPRVPRSPYGVSKLAAEEYARVYHELFGLRTSIVRPFSVYGPGQRKLVVHDLLARALRGETPMEIAAPAEVTRDFVYIDDVARAIAAVATKANGAGDAFNVCSGRGTSLRELVDAIFACVAPDAEARFTGRIRLGDPVHWVGDPKALDALGVTCDVPLEEGLGAVATAVRETNW